jgi:hypothetical protein
MQRIILNIIALMNLIINDGILNGYGIDIVSRYGVKSGPYHSPQVSHIIFPIN